MFEHVSIITTGDHSKTGTVSLRFYELSAGVYMKEDGCETPDPFQDPQSINPFSNSYQVVAGHHLIDLAYYSEFTVIERTFRICFHDVSQEIGISLNFPDVVGCLQFFDHLKANLTIAAQELQSLFIILRLCPPIINSDIYFPKNANSAHPSSDKSGIDLNHDALLDAHSKFISKISPDRKRVTADSEELKNGFLSKENMMKLVFNHNIPNDEKADVWGFLIGIYPLNEIPEEKKENYSIIKNQWKSITKSQFLRSTAFYQEIKKLLECIKNNRQKILTVIPDKKIIRIVFDVLMSIKKLYYFIDKLYNELIMVIRVFIWMFVKDTIVKDGKDLYVIHYDLFYDDEELETVLFWSMIYFIEKNEIRRFCENEKNSKKFFIEEINNFILLTHPEMYKLLQQKGISDFERMFPLFTMGFSSILPFCDTADIWITALSSSNFYLFMEFMIISCVFLNFPNILFLQQSKKQDITPFIEQIFRLLDHFYVENTALKLMDCFKKLIQSNAE